MYTVMYTTTADRLLLLRAQRSYLKPQAWNFSEMKNKFLVHAK